MPEERMLTVERVEFTSRAARVYLSDGSRLDGLFDVRASCEVEGIARVSVEAYVVESAVVRKSEDT